MPTYQVAFETGTALGSGETDSHTLKQPGADKLSGIVNRTSTNYDVSVAWLNTTESVVETESIGSNVSGDTQTTFDLPARSPYARLDVADNGSSTGAYDLSAHLR